MFKRILYPTDFSDVSKKALDYIKQLKESGVEEEMFLGSVSEMVARRCKKPVLIIKR